MSYLDRSQIVELARKTREIDEKPSAVLEPFYLRELEKHAAKYPNDLNFIVEFAKPGKANISVGGNAYGVATCLEDYCWIDVRLGSDPEQADGGKQNGFGSLWEYQNHCESLDHLKGRTERCMKSITYLPTANQNAPTAAAAGPSRAAPYPASRAPSTATATSSQASASKSGRGIQISSPLSQPQVQSSSKNILQPTQKQNLQVPSPWCEIDSKPDIKPKSILSMLEDDEVSFVRPEDVPLEYRRVTNKSNPYMVDDDEDSSAPQPSSSVSADTRKADSARTTPASSGRNVLPKPEPGSGRSQIAHKSHSFLTPDDLPVLQARVRMLRTERDTAVRSVQWALVKPRSGAVRWTPSYRAAIDCHSKVLANLLCSGSDDYPYPSLHPVISATNPHLVPIDNLAQIKHEALRKSNKELQDQISLVRARGILSGGRGYGLVPSQAPVPAPAAVFPGSAAAVMPIGAIASGIAAVDPHLNPLGLAGDELEDYNAERYGERDQPTDLQAFFQNAIQDFGEDQDVDKALRTLGLTSMDQRLGDMTISLMPHQILGVAFMLEKERDSKYRGGLLCDAMGLGKTVQTIGALCGNQSEDARVKTTLIVAPLAVLQQWKTEIESKTAEGTFNIFMHHGATRTKNPKDLKHADIVLTTYGTLVSDFAEPKVKQRKKRKPIAGLLPSDIEEDDAPPPPAKKKKGPCFRMRFFRVVLDEAHFIRNRATQASRAVADLDAVHRWSLTGTLINNSLDDVYPHLRFLGISPQSEWTQFSKHITQRVKKAPRLAANRTQAILKTCMMRRHKESTLNGQRLLNLPPKETQEMTFDFSPEERAIYDQVERRMKIKFGTFLKQGTVLKNMSCVLTMLMRLRQLTCHPWLLRRNPGDPAHPEDFMVSDDDLNSSMNMPNLNIGEDFVNAATLLGEEWVAEVVDKLKKRFDGSVNPERTEEVEQDNECSICLDVYDNETITECKHSFCRVCINEIFTTAPRDGGDLSDEQTQRGARKCPMCRAVIEKNKLFAALAFFDPSKEDEKPDVKPDVKPDMNGGEASGSGSGSERKRKSTGNSDDDDFEPDSSHSAKRANKGKGKAKEEAEPTELPAELDEIVTVLPSTKMKVLGDLVDEYLAESDIKVIIFSEFVTYLKLVERFLENRGIPNCMYHGAMRSRDREDTIREFTGPIKSDQSSRVMLISRKAGGAGLNLTAACKVISLDLAWNAAAENQAVDRAHRIGQTRPVDVRRLIINGTVEQRILALQERKSALADGAMGEGAGGRLGRLTVQDLMRLFDYNAADDA